jgi:hypothetical protein
MENSAVNDAAQEMYTNQIILSLLYEKSRNRNTTIFAVYSGSD